MEHLRAGSNSGSPIGQSQQLTDTFDRGSVAALAQRLSALELQSD